MTKYDGKLLGNKSNFISIVRHFKGKRIAVFGDVMLDQFVWGDAERISPEAPVPIVRVTRETFMLGGAGNVASNVVALGGEAVIFGILGKDEAGRRFLREARKQSIYTTHLITTTRYSTIQKERVIAHGQQVVRVDREIVGFRNSFEDDIIRRFTAILPTLHAVVFSDYAKGFFTRKLVRALISIARKHKKPIIADIKPVNASFFKGVTLLTPNRKEAFEISQLYNASIWKVGKSIQKQFSSNVLITQGALGMTLFSGDIVTHFSTQAREVFDVSGAGDTVVATLALGLCASSSLAQLVAIANRAAGIVVGKLGTATVSLKELEKDFQAYGSGGIKS